MWGGEEEGVWGGEVEGVWGGEEEGGRVEGAVELGSTEEWGGRRVQRWVRWWWRSVLAPQGCNHQLYSLQ